MPKSLENRIALITGASRGIGAAVAKRYAKEGAHVILVARTIGGLEETDDAIQKAGGQATLVPCDLTEEKKIEELANHIYSRFGKLDIMVGNAAMLGPISPLIHIPVNKWEEVFNINVTANFRLIKAFDPLLRISDSGRVIFVSSGVSQSAFPYWGPYAVSKAALEMLARTYASECEKTSIRVNLIDPGVVKTRMRAEAMPGENTDKLAKPEDITDRFVELAKPNYAKSGQRLRA